MGVERRRKPARQRCENTLSRCRANKDLTSGLNGKNAGQGDTGLGQLATTTTIQFGNWFGDVAGEEQSNNWSDKVFANHVLFKKIARYLRVAELKILRQVSMYMLKQVNRYERFVNSLRITICKESNEEGVLALSTLPWKKARIFIEECPRFDELEDCLSLVEDLKVYMPPSNYTPTLLSLTQISDLLLQMHSLKFLSLPSELLEWCMIISEVSNKLITLEGFVLYGQARLETNPLEIMYGEGDEFVCSLKNWMEIAVLAWNLKTVQLDTVLGGVEEVLLRRHSTLESLKRSYSDLQYKVANVCIAIHVPSRCYDLVFPCLNSIEYHIYCSADEDRFANFLMNQPDLEFIELGVHTSKVRTSRRRRNGHQQQISRNILDAIRVKSTKLQTLILHARNLSWVESFPDPMEWEFLRECKHLKEFKIPGTSLMFDFAGENYAQPWIQCLPSNITSIGLFNLRATSDMGPIARFDGFPHLTQLEFTSDFALFDDALQSICRENTKLRIFHFGIGHRKLTDFGITGEQMNGTGNSGISLRNLTELTIFGCGRLTTEGFVKAIKFLELRKLNLRDTQIKMPGVAVLEISKNNPSLEYLDCVIPLPWDVRTFLREIKAVNQRLNNLGVQQWNDSNEVSFKPSYGIQPIVADSADSEYHISKNELDQCVLSTGPTPSTSTD